MSATIHVERMRYHGPGWRSTEDRKQNGCRDWFVWAPSDTFPDWPGYRTEVTRTDWSACYSDTTSDASYDDGFATASTAEDAMTAAGFDPAMIRRFMAAINQEDSK